MCLPSHVADSNHYIFETPEGLCARFKKCFEEPTGCHKMLGARTVTRNKFDTDDVEILGDVLQKFSCPGGLRPPDVCIPGLV